MKTYQVPNPASPRQLKPVELITDRAKRYRATRNPPPGAKQCAYCGSKENVEVEHIDGNESNSEPHNLLWACRSCNTTKGAYFAKHGHGIRTRQYNPSADGAKSLAQWVKAVMRVKGYGDEMTLKQAVAMIHATPASKRSEYARSIWSTRRERGTDTWQSSIPF